MQIKISPPKNIKSGSPYDSQSFGDKSSSIARTDAQQLSVYEKLEWVAISVDRVSSDVARPISFVDKNNQKIEESRIDRQIVLPIKNGYFNDNFLKMISNMVAGRLLAGNSYFFKAQTNEFSFFNDAFDSFIPFRSDEIKPVTSLNEKVLLGYLISLQDGRQGFVPREKLVDFSQNNIGRNPFEGIGNISKMRLMVEGEAEALEFNNEFIENKAAPSLAISSDESMTVEDHERSIDMLRGKYEGRGNRGRLMYAVGENVKIQAFSLSQKDMQFLEMKIHNRQSIISMFGCNPIVLGIPEGTNRATAQVMITQYRSNINTIIKQVENDLNKQFIHPIDPNVFIRFEKWPTGNVEEVEKAIRAGAITPNRGSELLGEDSDPKDKARSSYYLINTLLPIDSIGADITPEPGKTAAIEDKKALGLEHEPDAVNLRDPKNVNAIVGHFEKSALQPKQFQAKYLRASLETRNRLEDKYAYELGQFFRKQGKRVVEAFNREFGTKADPTILKDNPKEAVNLIFDLNFEAKEFTNEIQRLETAGVQKGIVDINKIVGANVSSTTSNPYVTSAIQALTQRTVNGQLKTGKVINVNMTTWKDIFNIVDKGVKENLTVTEISNNIGAKFDEYDGMRARRIARTESRAAWDGGAEIAYKELGVETVDVVGCEDLIPDCGKQDTPIALMSSLEFHPNHLGSIVPSKVI